MAVRDATAVVRILVVDVVVQRIEAHVAVPRACEERKRRERRPFRLCVTVGSLDDVVLVPPQVAQRAVVVDESAAALMLAVVRHARSQPERAAGDLHALSDAGVDAAEIAVEIGDTTRGSRQASQEREILTDETTAAV